MNRCEVSPKITKEAHLVRPATRQRAVRMMLLKEEACWPRLESGRYIGVVGSLHQIRSGAMVSAVNSRVLVAYAELETREEK